MARFNTNTFRSLNESIARIQNPIAALDEAMEYTSILEAVILDLCEALDLDPQALVEDVFDSAASASASRANVKKATKVLGAKSPHTKALSKLHNNMKKSRHYYGVTDSELERKYDTDTRRRKPTLSPMSGKAVDGYDAVFGGSKKGVNLGVIKKASSAIKNAEQARKSKKR